MTFTRMLSGDEFPGDKVSWAKMFSECWNDFLRQPPKFAGWIIFQVLRFNLVVFYIESKLDLWAFRISSF